MARMTGKPKETEERRLKSRAGADRREQLLHTLKTKIWPSIPKKELGRRLTRQGEAAILGYGPEGV